MTAQEIRVEAVRVEHLRAAVRYSRTVKEKAIADHEALTVAHAAFVAAMDAEIAAHEAKIEGGG